MKFLNGYKTVLGIGLTLASVILPAIGKDASILPAIGQTLSDIGDHAATLVTGIGAALTLLGLKHKAEKRADQ